MAVVGGPMYDHLYRVFEQAEPRVEVLVHADHPTLNRAVADLLSAGERLDLISTHSKYAPSQARWLRALDDLVAPSTVGALAPLAVELCRFDGAALCLPRLIDVRIMWMRSDRGLPVPTTWDDLLTSGVRFGFPGRESGLFGTFFELVVGVGGRIFDDDGAPCFESAQAEWAVGVLRRLAERAPSDLPDWHYDQVDAALLEGRIDAAGVWPGGTGPIARSRLAGVLRPHRYPAGTQRWVSYAGCHAWAIPTTCGNLPGALELLHRLLGHEAQRLDASGGNVCANRAAFDAAGAADEVDEQRRAILADTISEAMITYPPHERFPEVEDAGWSALRNAITGVCQPDDALTHIQRAAEAALS